MKDHDWIATSGEMVATADYRPETHEFEVVVTMNDGRNQRRMVRATYEPRFGIDVADMDEIMIAAEELAKAIEP